MKTSKTIQENNERIEHYQIILKTLNSGLLDCTVKTENAIVAEIEKIEKIIEFLQSTKTFNYNFKSFGWNSGNGVTIEEAITGELERWEETLDNTRMDLKSFRVATDYETERLMSLFY